MGRMRPLPNYIVFIHFLCVMLTEIYTDHSATMNTADVIVPYLYLFLNIFPCNTSNVFVIHLTDVS